MFARFLGEQPVVDRRCRGDSDGGAQPRRGSADETRMRDSDVDSGSARLDSDARLGPGYSDALSRSPSRICQVVAMRQSECAVDAA